MEKESSCRCRVEEVNPLEDGHWDQQVRSHNQAAIFHESAWARVLVETYGHTPVYLRFRLEDRLMALVPMMELTSWPKGRRGVGLPFSDFCAPLLFSEECGAAVRRGVEELARRKRWRYAELRGNYVGGECETGGDVRSFVGHELRLCDRAEDQFAKLDPSARRSVRKAERSALTVIASETWSAMRKYVRLHEKTRRRQGVPPQPLSFFRSIHEILVKGGKGFVSLVENKGEPVAGAVFLLSGGRAIYKFGASDRTALMDRPNHLAIWEGIRTLIEQKCTVLHFGRTSNGQEGLRRFKKSWGAREIAIDYMRFFPHRGHWSLKPGESSPAHVAGLRFIPLPINRLAGRILYSHLD